MNQQEPRAEKLREDFLQEFFEPTFIDLRPYDVSFMDEKKIDWWIEKLRATLADQKEEIRKKVEGMKKKNEIDFFGNVSLHENGYNQALEDVLKILE